MDILEIILFLKMFFKLSPAHFLEFKLEKKEIKISNYWKIEDYFKISNKKEEEIIDELEEILIDGFRLRMVSDVEVGVFLSGGVDSSLVASILQKHYGNINTFTIGFRENRYDESKYAKEVASHIGTNHFSEILEVDKAREILKNFVKIYDEPFGDSSGIPTYLVSQIAKENGVKVVLSADGGDELFCGYERYWFCENIINKFSKLPFKKGFNSLLNFFNPLFLRIPIKNMEHKLGFLSNILTSSSYQEMYETMIKNYRDDIKEILNISPKFVKRSYFEFGKQFDIKQAMMLWDFYNYLPNDILVKMDRATMYNSIEGREPLLDNKIIEYSATIPFELKYKNKESKYILKKVLERYLPKELIYRKKMGFGIPMIEWFKKDLLDMFEEYFKEDDEIVNMQFVREKLNEFKSGKYVNINKLWFVLVYKMWKREYL
jgi:asparagine synthase (glutamine-hydrolysing)